MAIGFLNKIMVICRIGDTGFQWNFTIFRTISNNMDFTIVYSRLKIKKFNAYERLLQENSEPKGYEVPHNA